MKNRLTDPLHIFPTRPLLPWLTRALHSIAALAFIVYVIVAGWTGRLLLGL